MNENTTCLSERAAAAIKPLQEVHEGAQTKYSCCFMNGCFGSACILKCNVKDGKLQCIEPDDTIHPNVTREHITEHDDFMHAMWQWRPCVQGHALKWDIYNPKRFTKPLKRVGWDDRGKGIYEEISWDEAIDLVATKLLEVREKFGPNSFWYSNEPVADCCNWALDPWTDMGVGCWGNISWSGPDTAGKFWMGWDVEQILRGMVSADDPMPRIAPDAMDFMNSKVIILWGWNALARDYQVVPMYLKQAREAGIPIIAIDPIYNWTAEVLADQWIPIRPGTDITLMLAMAYVMFDEDLCDKEFMDKWVEPDGVVKFKNYVFGGEDGEPKTPEWAEQYCGVPAETIYDLARVYGNSKPSHLHFNIGNGREHHGEYASAMAIILQAMNGSTMTPGGFNGALDFNLNTDFGMMPMPYFQFGHAPREFTPKTLIQGVCLSEAVELHKDLEAGKITEKEYNHRIGNAPGNPTPNIQMLCFGSHHINNLPDVNTRIKAVKDAYFTMGWHFSPEQLTPKFLDLVLPAMHRIESNDQYWYESLFTTPFEHSCGGCWNYITYVQTVIDPPEGQIPRDYFWKKVAEKIGIGDKYATRFDGVGPDEWMDLASQLHREGYEGWSWAQNPGVIEAYGGPLPTWDEFIENGCIIRTPVKEPYYYSFKDLLEAGKNPFHTTSGKIEFSVKYLEEHDLDDERYCGHLDPIPRWIPSYDDQPPKDTLFHEDAKRYPLCMVTPVTQYRQHSFHWDNPMMNGECYRHAVWINPIDAARRGIKDGEIVRVFNDMAESHLPVYVTWRIAPRIVSLQHGAWYNTAGEITEKMPFGIDTAGACNLFTDMKFGKDNVNTLKTTALVQIEKLEG